MWGRAEQAASSLQKATRGSFVLSEQGQRGRKSETSEQQAGNLGAVRPPPAVRGPRRVSRQPSATPPEGRFSCSQPACASRGAHCVPHLSPPETGRMCLALRGPGRPPQILRAAPQEVWLKAGPRPTPDVFYAENAVERSIRPAPVRSHHAVHAPAPATRPCPGMQAWGCPPGLHTGQDPRCWKSPGFRSRGAREGEGAVVGCPSGLGDRQDCITGDIRFSSRGTR